jgi:hypothetical protein
VDRGDILRGISGRLGGVVKRRGGGQGRRVDAKRTGEFGDDRAVLLQDMHRRGRRRVDALGHHRAAQFEDARGAGAAADDLEDARRVEPGLDAEHERLGGGDVVHRDEQVGDELHPAAVAEFAEVMRRPGEGVEHRRHAAKGGLVAAGIDREVARHRLRPGAGDRAVQQGDAGGGEAVARRRLDRDRQGADLGDDEAGHRLCRKLGRGAVERLAARQAGQGESGAADRIGRGCCRGDAVEIACGVGVVAAHRIAGGEQVAGDRPAHDAEADDRDGARRRRHQLCRIGSPRTYLPRQNISTGLSV